LRLATLVLVFLTIGNPVLAHVEKGAMPDSVAEMEYRILLEFTPQDTATRSLLGMALLRQGKLAEAENEFLLVLQNDAKNFDALDGLGMVLFKQKRYSEALQHLLPAIKIRPNDIMIHLHLGLTLSSDGQTEGAKKTLESGIILLSKQTPSALRDQQLAEFKAALAPLPKKTGTASLQ
jgi:tetratricopeptide (TPR) repeat protein